MKLSEVVKKIVKNHQFVMIRVAKDFVPEKGKPIQYEVRGWIEEKDSITEDQELTGKVVKNGGFFMLDAFTASGLLQIYEAINEANREKFDTLSLKTNIDFMWKMAK